MKKNRNALIIGLIGFIGLLTLFSFYSYYLVSAKTKFIEKLLNSFINTDIKQKEVSYVLNTKDSVSCNSSYFGVYINTECFIKNIDLSVKTNQSNTDQLNLEILSAEKLIINLKTGLFDTNFKKIKSSGITANIDINNIQPNQDFLYKISGFTKDQIHSKIQPQVDRLFKQFDKINIKTNVVTGKENKLMQTKINLNSIISGSDWIAGNVFDFVFQINQPTKVIQLFDTKNEDNSTSELKLYLPYEINVLNSNIFLMAANRNEILNVFYDYYSIMHDLAFDKEKYNENLLNLKVFERVSFNSFVGNVAPLLSQARGGFAFTSEAPMVEAIYHLFNGELGSCYKVKRNPESPLVPYSQIEELMKVNPEVGMELNKKSFIREVIPCNSEKECQNKCEEIK